MATTMAIQPLAPRPSAHEIASWSPPRQRLMDGKENRPALKQLQQHSSSAPRPRRERPCDGCRRRKSKCVLQEGRRCVLCEFHKQECTFVENAQPRKRKLDDGSKAASSPNKRSPATTQPSTPSTGPPQSQPLFEIPTPNFSAPPVQQAPTKALFPVDETLSLQRHRHCRYVGQTTALDASLIGLGNFNDGNETESQVGLLRRVTDTEYFSTHADADVPIPDDEARALADIEQAIGPHGPKLIDIYFRNLHPSYPIIQKQAFLDRHRHGDRQFNPPLLAAMYLLALGWWEQDPTLASQPKPDAARLEYIAITSLTMSMQRPKISAVQAGLLLLQRAKSSTWTLTVQLVALGQDIGLHLDCTNWSIPLWERRLRIRLAWALFMQDKWSAITHGRPSHISSTDWAVPLPQPSDFSEAIPPLPPSPDEHSATTQKGRSCFAQMITLTSIMSDVHSTFYSQTAKSEIASAGRHATQFVLNRAKPVQIRLKNWFANLPSECKMETYKPSQLSSTGYLHLAYFATEISIHRVIVQSLSPSTSDPYLLYICRSAAKTRLISAMDFVNRLRPEHLRAFWYFASPTNFALIGTFGALLLVTSPGEEEAGFYRARLREYRWTLGVSSGLAPWVGLAVEGVDANEGLLEGMGGKPKVADAPRMANGGWHGGVNGDGGTSGGGGVRFADELSGEWEDGDEEGMEEEW